MSIIQPGNGYTFSASSLGTNLNISQPWGEWDSTPGGSRIIQQFELLVKRVGGVDKLQLANGTVCFTQSNMPRVRQGAHYDQRQGYITKTAVFGTGVSTTAGTGSSVLMEAGGYYNLTTAGTYYVTISKFDVTATFDDTDSTLLNEEAPFVSIFKASDPLQAKLLFETGPSEYVNFTNVQKMAGYDADSTSLAGDWGNCHTTWFNPVKWGYSVKLIGIVTATAVVGGIRLSIDQHIVGPIDLQIPVLFNGTTLTNQVGLTETADPYNANKNSIPKWLNIVNNEKFLAIGTIVPANTDWYQEFIGTADWTEKNYSYLKVASCANQDDNACEFPFQFHPVVLSDGGEGYFFRANVCGGMVNNLVPWNDVGPSRVKLPTTIDFGPGFTGDMMVYLRLGTEASDTDEPIFPVTNDADEYYPTLVQSVTPLVDTNEYCYILMAVARNVGNKDTFTIDQTISGSVWVERLKIGANVAQYYWAGV